MTHSGDWLHRSPPPDSSSDETDERDWAVFVDGLSKQFDGPTGPIQAVDDVSFTIESGSVVGVLGPNGAGKTTMIKSMLGLIRPSEGQVRINAIDVYNDPGRAYAHCGAMLEGARNVYWRLTVRENLEYFASLVGLSPGTVRDRHDELLETFDLLESADTVVNDLSRGMKQKVSLICTLARGATVLFLDEPTLGLDIESSIALRRELLQLVERESMTVVLSSHDMTVIEELCDRVIIMNEGSVIADDTVENLTGVFESKAYEITMDGQLPSSIRESIEHEYSIEEYDRTAGRDRFEITLENESFYDLTDILRTSSCHIAAIDSIQPDLESVFLTLTNNDTDSEAVPETATGDELS